jgi:drug/metabolite transporter (DMT)-like permease
MWKPAMPQAQALAYLGLLFNALVWGLSWWPFRALSSLGVHPLWATAIIYAICMVVLTITHREHLSSLFQNPWLLLLFLSSGVNNAAFNWAVTVGEVIRVVLLFYLMPMWVALLSWLLLVKRPGKNQCAQIALALFGAYLVLRPIGSDSWAFPIPNTLPDWLGLLGGATFALTTVLLSKTANEPAGKATLAMFGGAALVSALLACALSQYQIIPGLAWQNSQWWPLVLVFGAALLASNLSFQYGARRVSSATASLIMLNEVAFATISSVWLGADSMSITKLMGLCCIVGATLVAIRSATSATN